MIGALTVPVKTAMTTPATAKVAATTYTATTKAVQPVVLAYSGNPFQDWRVLLLGFMGFLALVAIVGGTLSAIGKLRRGTGEAILTQIGVIGFGALIGLTAGITAAVIDWGADNAGVDPTLIPGREWGL
ncbi:hypothetical protein [Mycobacteroides abscessus]|uniref:hypothetical protein n=1 Tax=Mycobacteroides abscessus TaxID=36809 RepID=UPI0002FCE427|nr:hypothetical protein [Mycobacteroides abscessus]